MKLSAINKLLLTLLYGVSVIFFMLIIFEGRGVQWFDEVITYAFYGCSVLTIIKALMDLVVNKRVKELIYLLLASMPSGVLLMYLVLTLR